MNISQETIRMVEIRIKRERDLVDNLEHPDTHLSRGQIISRAAIVAFIESKEMAGLLSVCGALLPYLEKLYQIDNPWAGVASDDLLRAILPFQSNDKKGA